MRQRLIGAAVLVPVVVILFVAGPPWLTLGIALLAAAAAYEIALLIKSAGLPANRWLVVAAPLLVAAAVAFGYGPNAAIVSAGFFVPAAGAWVILTAIDAFRRPDARDGFLGWAGHSWVASTPAC
ncbi:MAG TPA: hypothetical protein VEX62_07700 [Candidatus Limnocylindrales bacterium]|nr:hypothetical protein [Candidatus Limnocylindrales bacterium]